MKSHNVLGSLETEECQGLKILWERRRAQQWGWKERKNKRMSKESPNSFHINHCLPENLRVQIKKSSSFIFCWRFSNPDLPSHTQVDQLANLTIKVELSKI